MGHVNRDLILKNFLDKVKEAKRMGMRDVKIPVRELDDLAYVIYQLMAEEISKALDKLEEKPKEEQVFSKPINRRVLEEIHIVKKPKEEVKPIVEEPKIVEEVKEDIVIEPKKVDNIPMVEEPLEEETEEDGLYGGSW